MAFLCPSPSAPATPDYAAAATAQGQANKETALLQGYLNNPNISGPLGGQTVTFDPITNQPTITQNLTPTAQSTLEAQQRVQQGLAGLGEKGLSTATDIISKPFQYTGPSVITSLADSGKIQGAPNLAGYGSASSVGADKYGLAGGISPSQYGLAQGGVQGVNLQTSLGNTGQINQDLNANKYLSNNQLDLRNVSQMPVNAGTTSQAAIMSRLAPQLERQQKFNAQNLANQGLVAGGEAYKNAMLDQSQQQNDLLTQAALQGINLDIGANQQGFNQALASGQFGNLGTQQNFSNALAAQQAQNAAQGQGYNQQLQLGQFGNQAQLANFAANLQNQQAANQAIAQNFGQGLSAQQLANQSVAQNFGQGQAASSAANAAIQQNQNTAAQQQQLANAAQLQQYNENLGQAQFGNNAATQSLQTQLALRNQPLNEITGLMSGSQLQMPQFQGYNPTNIAPAPVFAGAQAQGAADMQRYGIQQSGANAQTSGLYSLAGAAAPLVFPSDRRLKSNIERIGTHKLGIGIYEYDILGERQQGVMADEVEKVMPKAIVMHPSGYKMVNYGLLNG